MVRGSAEEGHDPRRTSNRLAGAAQQPAWSGKVDPFNVPPSGALFCNPASVCMVIFKQRQLSQQLSRLDGIP